MADDDLGAFMPNPAVIRFADEIPQYNGRIEAALLAACPGFVDWTEYWIAQGVWR